MTYFNNLSLKVMKEGEIYRVIGFKAYPTSESASLEVRHESNEELDDSLVWWIFEEGIKECLEANDFEIIG